MYSFLCYFLGANILFFLRGEGTFLLFFLTGGWGPDCGRQDRSGSVGTVVCETATADCMALRAARSGIEMQDYTHTVVSGVPLGGGRFVAVHGCHVCPRPRIRTRTPDEPRTDLPQGGPAPPKNVSFLGPFFGVLFFLFCLFLRENGA